MKIIEGGVCAAKGFKAGSVRCGIKASRTNDDTAIIFSECECNAAATYTMNRVKAAPVYVTMEHLENGVARAIVANSGNANACAPDGMENARRMAKAAASFLGVEEEDVAVASTGVIGQRINIECIEEHLPEIVLEDDASEKETAAGMCPGRVCMEGGRPLRCLLVDDDPLQLEMTAVLCRELGIETESCPFPEYAEKLVQESAFDLVFTDIQMPGVDGFEVLRRIRAVRAELPVVAVSARSDDESAYVERGFAAVLRKPFARAELVAVLRRVVPEAGVAPEECLPEEDAVRGFEALTAFARDDAEAAREIIRTFVAENEAHAETLRRAALAGDAVALRAIAHKMVPIYTLLGEEELAAALRRLERSEGSADGALRSAALGVAERVGEIVRAAKKEYLCDR